MGNVDFASSLIAFSSRLSASSEKVGSSVNSALDPYRIKASFMSQKDAEYLQLNKDVSACLCISLGGEHHKGDALAARVDNLKNYADDKAYILGYFKRHGHAIHDDLDSGKFEVNVMVADTLNKTNEKKEQCNNASIDHTWKKLGDIFDLGDIQQEFSDLKEAGLAFIEDNSELFESLKKSNIKLNYWFWHGYEERMALNPEEQELFNGVLRYLEECFAEGLKELREDDESIGISKYDLRYICEEIAIAYMYIFRGHSPEKGTKAISTLLHLYPGQMKSMFAEGLSILKSNAEIEVKCQALLGEENHEIIDTYISNSDGELRKAKINSEFSFVNAGMPKYKQVDALARQRVRRENLARLYIQKGLVTLNFAKEVDRHYKDYLLSVGCEVRPGEMSLIKQLEYVDLLSAESRYGGNLREYVGDKVDRFLQSDKKQLLLLGGSGAGKSRYLKYLLKRTWQDYVEGKLDSRIPFYVDMSMGLGGIAEKLSAFKELPLLILFDGYNEKSGEDFNLSVACGLTAFEDVKIITACRHQYYSHVNKEVWFYGAEKDPSEAHFLPLSLDDQVPKIIKSYVDLVGLISPEKEELVRYYHEKLSGLPGLKEVVQNPLILIMTLDVILEPGALQPKSSSHSKVVSVPDFSVSSLYNAFLNKRFKLESQKLAHKFEGDIKVVVKKIQQILESLCCDVAVEMMKDDSMVISREKLLQVVTKALGGLNTQDVRFIEQVIECLPLGSSNASKDFSFFHQSVRDYFFAKAIFGDIQYVIKIFRRSKYSANKIPFANFVSDELIVHSVLFKRLITNLSLLNKAKKPVFCSEAMDVVQFLGDLVCAKENLIDLLLAVVLKSRASEEPFDTCPVSIAASNAITVLSAIGFNFSGMDLSDIKIPYANLAGAKLHETNLSRAYCRGVKFDYAYTSGLLLQDAILDRVKLKEFLLRSKEKMTASSVCEQLGLMAVAENNTVKILKLNDGEVLSVSGDLPSRVRALYFDSQAKILMGVSEEFQVHSWTHRGKYIGTIQLQLDLPERQKSMILDELFDNVLFLPRQHCIVFGNGVYFIICNYSQNRLLASFIVLGGMSLREALYTRFGPVVCDFAQLCDVLSNEDKSGYLVFMPNQNKLKILKNDHASISVSDILDSLHRFWIFNDDDLDVDSTCEGLTESSKHEPDLKISQFFSFYPKFAERFNELRSMEYSHSNKMLGVLGQEVEIWDLLNHTKIKAFPFKESGSNPDCHISIDKWSRKLCMSAGSAQLYFDKAGKYLAAAQVGAHGMHKDYSYIHFYRLSDMVCVGESVFNFPVRGIFVLEESRGLPCLIVYGDNIVQKVCVKSGVGLAKVFSEEIGLSKPAFSRDESCIAVETIPGVVKIFDVEKGCIVSVKDSMPKKFQNIKSQPYRLRHMHDCRSSDSYGVVYNCYRYVLGVNKKMLLQRIRLGEKIIQCGRIPLDESDEIIFDVYCLPQSNFIAFRVWGEDAIEKEKSEYDFIFAELHVDTLLIKGIVKISNSIEEVYADPLGRGVIFSCSNIWWSYMFGTLDKEELTKNIGSYYHNNKMVWKFCSNGSCFFSLHDRKEIKVWGFGNKQYLQVIDGFGDLAHDIKVSSTGQYILVQTFAKGILVYKRDDNNRYLLHWFTTLCFSPHREILSSEIMPEHTGDGQNKSDLHFVIRLSTNPNAMHGGKRQRVFAEEISGKDQGCYF